MAYSTMSLLFCKQTHLCEFSENFGGGAAMAKSLFITFPRAMAAPPPKFSRTHTSELLAGYSGYSSGRQTSQEPTA